MTMQAEPPVLAITNELPWPLDTGGHLRTYHLVCALARGHDVRLIAPDGPARAAAQTVLQAAGVGTRFTPIRSRPLFDSAAVIRARLRREPYVLFARHRNAGTAAAVADEIARRPPAMIYCDHLDAMVYEPLFGDRPVVLDMQNVYSRLAARAADEYRGPRRWYLRREAAMLQATERWAVRRATVVLAVSEDEAHHLRTLGAQVAVVPNGVDCMAFDDLDKRLHPHDPTILYVGSFDWPPNASAAEFLATSILPAVQHRVPGCRLALVGRDPTPPVMRLAVNPRVVVSANVPDVRPYYQSADVMAVPLASGGGTRLKILEAFAAGVPVVSTPVGCEGLQVKHGVHLLVAERHEMADALMRVLDDRALSRGLAERARQFVRERYDWSVVARQVHAAVREAA